MYIETETWTKVSRIAAVCGILAAVVGSLKYVYWVKSSLPGEVPDFSSPWFVAIAAGLGVSLVITLMAFILATRERKDADFEVIETRWKLDVRDDSGEDVLVTKTRHFKPRVPLTDLHETRLKCTGEVTLDRVELTRVNRIGDDNGQIIGIQPAIDDTIDDLIVYRVPALEKNKMYRLTQVWHASGAFCEETEWFELKVKRPARRISIHVVPHENRPIVPGSTVVRAADLEFGSKVFSPVKVDPKYLVHNIQGLMWTFEDPPKGKLYKLQWDWQREGDPGDGIDAA